MVVGILRVGLLVPGARSLKDKRQVLRRVIDRTRAHFDVAVAEVGDGDLWQRAQLGVAAVGNDRRVVNGVLDQVVRFVAGIGGAEIAGHALEIQSLGEDFYPEAWPEPGGPGRAP